MTVRTGPLPAAEKKRDMPFLCTQDGGDFDVHPPCGHARPHPRCRVYADDTLHRSRIRPHRSPLPGVRGRHTAPVPDTMTSIPAAGCTQTTHCTGPGYDDIDPRCRVYAEDPEPDRPAGDPPTGSRDRELRGVSHQPRPGDCQRTLGNSGQACGEPLFPKERPVSPGTSAGDFRKKTTWPGISPLLFWPLLPPPRGADVPTGWGIQKDSPTSPPIRERTGNRQVRLRDSRGEREMRAST